MIEAVHSETSSSDDVPLDFESDLYQTKTDDKLDGHINQIRWVG